MPIGSLSAVPYVVNALVQRRPKRILDLGCGMGFYGAACRQWLDMGVKPRSVELIGVEGWHPYQNEAWKLYDHILEMTIEEAVDQLPRSAPYDAILLCDVIEHFEKAAAAELLPSIEELISPGGAFVVVTPAIWMEQGAAHGNELERHRSLWTIDDFTSRGFSILLDGSPDHFGCQMLAALKAF